MANTDEQHGEALLDKVTGKVKETLGKITGDHSTEAEGKIDQAKGGVREGVANIRDKMDDKNKNV